jgi:hypothetical protein
MGYWIRLTDIQIQVLSLCLDLEMVHYFSDTHLSLLQIMVNSNTLHGSCKIQMRSYTAQNTSGKHSIIFNERKLNCDFTMTRIYYDFRMLFKKENSLL